MPKTQINKTTSKHSGPALAKLAAVSAVLMGMAFATHSTAKADERKFTSPEILMLGDSQLSFGAGEVVSDFFQNIEQKCAGIVDQAMLLEELQKMRATLIGARSSSLQSWTTTEGWAYDRLCKKDKNWGVNASIWGYGRNKNVPYIQIGEHKDYRFCEKGKTPLQVLFEQGYQPELLVFNILGNNAKRWAKNPELAEVDVARFIELTPAHIKCVYMTTLPIHTKRRNDQRLKAQKAIRAAFEKADNRCSFVGTMDAQTVSAIQGQNHYFKRKKNGAVKDPFHPQKRAAQKVYDLKRTEICQAIAQAYMPKQLANADISSQTLNLKMQSVPNRTNAISVTFDSRLRGFIQ